MKEKELIRSLCDKAIKNNDIKISLYDKYNVKRGLRKQDRTGVLVGLTNIGEVKGYYVDDNEKKPRKGKLLYRGYDVTKLVKGFQQDGRLGFEEICYLLLFGALPDSTELADFCKLLGEMRNLPDDFTEDMILKVPSINIMNKLARSILVLYSYDEHADELNIMNVLYQCLKLIARVPTLVAYGYQAMAHNYENKSLYLHNPVPNISTAENILLMIRPTSKYTKLEAETMDLALVLHAEHGGGNNSAFTVHVVASTDTDTYSAIAAAVGSLKGGRHGGASLRVSQMIDDLKKTYNNTPSEEDIKEYLKKLVNKEAFDKAGLIYGMGHAVYTLSDPRAVLLKEKARELAAEKGMLDEFEIYNTIEKLSPKILRSEKKANMSLCANIDLYSGFVYRMLGISESLYTPIFAVARMAGWAAHRIEQLVGGGKIIRPAYKCVQDKGKYIPINKRAQTKHI
jgi:citrate synthase